MLKKIKATKGSKFEFTFPSGEHAGEHYGVEFGFCPNPVCRCGAVSVNVLSDKPENSETFAPSFGFRVDVIKKELDTSVGATSKYNQNFGSVFVHHLTEEDWALLVNLFYSYKRQITDEVPDEELDAQFPAEEIEYSGAMVGFHEILPYAENKILEIEDASYLLDEQYCVRPSCNCSDVTVSLLDLSEEHDDTNLTNCPVIFLDYENANWRIERTAGEDAQLIKRVANTLNSGEYPSVFSRHHARLRSLYQSYKKRHGGISAPVLSTRKIGRNDPCPCGSGKKYKKCCMGSLNPPWQLNSNSVFHHR